MGWFGLGSSYFKQVVELNDLQRFLPVLLFCVSMMPGCFHQELAKVLHKGIQDPHPNLTGGKTDTT